MKKKRPTLPTLEDEQRALAEARGAPRSDVAKARLGEALGSLRAPVVASAARLIQAQSLDGYHDALRAAFARFLEDAVKTDPGCSAKLAVLDALDYAESLDAEPFVAAVRHVQMEPAWGPPVDTAAGLRQRGIFALARLGHGEFDLHAAALLADAEPPVRQAAAEALAHRGDRAGAALALLKLRVGDEDPMVVLAAMGALLALAPERGVAEARARLLGADADERELAAVALGQSRGEAGLGVLLAALDDAVTPGEREPLLRGIGLHRSEAALVAMLRVIREGAKGDAAAAVTALASRRFEPAVEARVREAARQNPRADLAAVVQQTFATASDD